MLFDTVPSVFRKKGNVMKKQLRLIVSGVVQGVGYRDHVRKNAESLGVEGSIRNLEDGRVLVNAVASADTLDIFLDCLYEGTDKSLVDDIEIELAPVARDFRGVFRVIGEE